MRTIVSTLFMTLDGVVESPHEWHLPYFSPEMGEVLSAGMQTQHAFLLGRTLYDEWSQYWPAHVDDDPFGRYITDVDKHVLTHRPLDGEPWDNTTVIGDDAEQQVQALKEQDDGEIGMSGSPSTVRWLLEHGLLDELNLLVDPIVLGRGTRLFDDIRQMELSLTHSRALPNGVLHLRYEPVAA
jgi:dihydrofolate reductase